MLKFKKYVYLLNDLTNAMLKKERIDFEAQIKKLKISLVIVSIGLLLSLFLNIILILD